MVTIWTVAEHRNSASPDPDSKLQLDYDNDQQYTPPHLEEVRKVEAPPRHATTPPTKYYNQADYSYHP